MQKEEQNIIKRELAPFDVLKEEKGQLPGNDIKPPTTKVDLEEIERQKQLEDEQKRQAEEEARKREEESNKAEENKGKEAGDDIIGDGNVGERTGGDAGDAGEGGGAEETQFQVEDQAITRYFAETLQQRGFLPEDFEVTDETTEADIDTAYITHNTEPLANTIREEELKRLREEEGITEEMIQEMKYRHYGVQDEELRLLNNMAYLHNYKFDERSETYEDDARAFLNDFYTLSFSGYSPERIESLVDNDLKDEKLADIVSEYQNQLGLQASSLKESIDKKALNAEESRKAKRKETREKREELLTKGEVNGKKYTPTQMERVRKALFVKSEIIQGVDGKRYKVTPYYKMVLESKQNLEVDLENKIRVILGDTGAISKAEKKGEEKGQKKVVGRLNKFITQASKKGGNQSNQKPQPKGEQKQESQIERRAIN